MVVAFAGGNADLLMNFDLLLLTLRLSCAKPVQGVFALQN
tara:strand:- start:455 stop:574 length:120 start_codon:yes stop_codon:yes gene_type:complete